MFKSLLVLILITSASAYAEDSYENAESTEYVQRMIRETNQTLDDLRPAVVCGFRRAPPRDFAQYELMQIVRGVKAPVKISGLSATNTESVLYSICVTITR